MSFVVVAADSEVEPMPVVCSLLENQAEAEVQPGSGADPLLVGNLPSNVWAVILSRLCLASAARLRLVSRTTRSAVDLACEILSVPGGSAAVQLLHKRGHWLAQRHIRRIVFRPSAHACNSFGISDGSALAALVHHLHSACGHIVHEVEVTHEAPVTASTRRCQAYSFSPTEVQALLAACVDPRTGASCLRLLSLPIHPAGVVRLVAPVGQDTRDRHISVLCLLPATLQSLRLSCINPMGPEGISAFAHTRHHLTRLELTSYTGSGPQAAALLCQLHNLQSLALSWPPHRQHVAPSFHHHHHHHHQQQPSSLAHASEPAGPTSPLPTSTHDLPAELQCFWSVLALGLPGLKELSVSGDATSIGVAQLVACMQGLERLDISLAQAAYCLTADVLLLLCAMPRLAHLGLHNVNVIHIHLNPPAEATQRRPIYMRLSELAAEYVAQMQQRETVFNDLQTQLALHHGDLRALALAVAELGARSAPTPVAPTNHTNSRDGSATDRSGMEEINSHHTLLKAFPEREPWLEAVLQLNQMQRNCDQLFSADRCSCNSTSVNTFPIPHSSPSTSTSATSPAALSTTPYATSMTASSSCSISIPALQQHGGCGVALYTCATHQVPLHSLGDHLRHLPGSLRAEHLLGSLFKSLSCLNLSLVTSNTVCMVLALCSNQAQHSMDGGAQLRRLRVSYPQSGSCTQGWLQGILCLDHLQHLELDGTLTLTGEALHQWTLPRRRLQQQPSNSGSQYHDAATTALPSIASQLQSLTITASCQLVSGDALVHLASHCSQLRSLKVDRLINLGPAEVQAMSGQLRTVIVGNKCHNAALQQDPALNQPLLHGSSNSRCCGTMVYSDLPDLQGTVLRFNSHAVEDQAPGRCTCQTDNGRLLQGHCTEAAVSSAWTELH